MVEPMNDEGLERLKNVALHGSVPALTVARLVARLDRVETDYRKLLGAVAPVQQHLNEGPECKVCGACAFSVDEHEEGYPCANLQRVLREL